jgi:hypothetical protein
LAAVLLRVPAGPCDAGFFFAGFFLDAFLFGAAAAGAEAGSVVLDFAFTFAFALTAAAVFDFTPAVPFFRSAARMSSFIAPPGRTTLFYLASAFSAATVIPASSDFFMVHLLPAAKLPYYNTE